MDFYITSSVLIAIAIYLHLHRQTLGCEHLYTIITRKKQTWMDGSIMIAGIRFSPSLNLCPFLTVFV